MKLFQNYLKNYHSEDVGGVFSMNHNDTQLYLVAGLKAETFNLVIT